MSRLWIYDETGRELANDDQYAVIAEKLAGIGVVFEQWQAEHRLVANADQEQVFAAYNGPIERLKADYGFSTADVVALQPDHPQRDEMRAKFLDEHVHGDFEVRFFVQGRGLFYLHVEDRVYAVLCEQGDLISVPADTRHWFDMGTAPSFKCVRFFTRPEGWVASFTGSDIAQRFPSFDNLVRAAA